MLECLEQAFPVLARDHALQAPDLLQVVIVLLQGLAELPVESGQLFAVEIHLLQLGLKIAQLLLVGDDLPGNGAGIDRRNAGAMSRADEKTAERRDKECCFHWIPAFAGMTLCQGTDFKSVPVGNVQMTNGGRGNTLLFVIPGLTRYPVEYCRRRRLSILSCHQFSVLCSVSSASTVFMTPALNP